MARSSADFWNDRVSNDNNRNSDSDDREGLSRRGNSDCDRESSKALKNILSELDDLNNSDLRLLRDIIDRLLCNRRC